MVNLHLSLLITIFSTYIEDFLTNLRKHLPGVRDKLYLSIVYKLK